MPLHPHRGRGVIDVSRYIYVDTAFGGVDHRNKVHKFTEVRLNGVSDCYVSHNRATDDLVSWVQTHENEKGNPTVKGFDGATWADNLHLDIDAEGNLGLALKRLHDVLDRLEAWGVDLGSIRIFFSGAKGFHIEIPHTLFGGFIPSKEFPKRLRRAAKRIFGDIPFDTSVYDALRLWRLENSRNAKSRLFKIRLTVSEARTASIDEITALAAEPRDTSTVPELAEVPDDEWMPVEELVGIWAATIVDDETPDREAWRAPTDAARDGQTSAAIAASWPGGGENKTEGEKPGGQVSRHADYLLPIVGFLARRTSPDHVRAIVEDAAEQANDQTFLNGRDWRGEIKRIAEGAEERIKKNESVKGLPSLAKQFPGLARVLPALWPAPTIDFDEEEMLSAQASYINWAESKSAGGLRLWTAREIGETTPAEPEWVARPWMARGAITEIDGKIKAAGKTTWALGMCSKMLDGVDFMGEPTTKTSIVYLTEQAPATFRQALARADLTDRDDFHALFWHDTVGIPWSTVVAFAAEAARQRQAVLFVDTVSQFANITGDSENNAGAALEAMRPLQEATARHNLAVGIVRHERKSGGDVGDSGRGSSAFAGAVDVVLSIRRSESHARPTIRVIHALSRFSETPDVTVVDLQDGEYVNLGSEEAVAAMEARERITQTLPLAEGDALEEKALLEAAGVKRSTGQRVLRELLNEGLATRIGEGRKRDPYRYWAGSDFHSAQATPPWAESNTEPAYTCAVCGIVTDSADLCVACEMEAAS